MKTNNKKQIDKNSKVKEKYIKKIDSKKYLNDKVENKIKTIMKFTFKETFFSKIFILTNFLMIAITIFLTITVLKLSTATKGYIERTTNEQIEKIYESSNEVEITNEVIENIKEETTNSVSNGITNTFNSGFLISFILFFTIYFYGYLVSNSVSEEKTSRVIETLIMSAKPKEIVIGKTIAMGLLGTLQMIELLLVLGITTIFYFGFDLTSLGLNFNLYFNFNQPSNMTLNFQKILSLFNITNIDLSNLSFSTYGLKLFLITTLLVLVLISYFIFGYLFYAFICAIAGAGVDKAEDVQMVNGPISILAMIGFYLAVLSSSMSDTLWAKLAKILPFSSSFAMPVNIINVTTSLQEICLSLIILILSSIWLGFMAIKVYKHVIFNYGNKTTLKDIFKIIFLKK